MNKDYCQKCGCPKDICCGQGRVSIEWLETQLELLLARSVWEMLPAYVWTSFTRDSYNKGVKEAEAQWHELIANLLSVAKKEVEK